MRELKCWKTCPDLKILFSMNQQYLAAEESGQDAEDGEEVEAVSCLEDVAIRVFDWLEL